MHCDGLYEAVLIRVLPARELWFTNPAMAACCDKLADDLIARSDRSDKLPSISQSLHMYTVHDLTAFHVQAILASVSPIQTIDS